MNVIKTSFGVIKLISGAWQRSKSVMRIIILILVFTTQADIAWTQCVIPSSDDYEVQIDIEPVGIDAPNGCPWGYNFNVEVDYTIDFVGPDAPAGMFTLQGNIDCDNFNNLFFDLPNNGGDGSTTTTTNPYNPDDDCQTATVTSLGCFIVEIEISGPGIPSQTVDCSSSALPVDLLVFNAKAVDDQVHLSWTTIMEKNNDFYTLERSVDGENWEAIGTVDGAGNANEMIHYTYWDENPHRGQAYYRLKQTDYDGQYEYSDVVPVTLKKHGDEHLIVYPNPGTDIIYVEGYDLDRSGLQVFNTLGQDVTAQADLIDKNQEQIILNVSTLAVGVYFIKAGNGTTKFYMEK